MPRMPTITDIQSPFGVIRKEKLIVPFQFMGIVLIDVIDIGIRRRKCISNKYLNAILEELGLNPLQGYQVIKTKVSQTTARRSETNPVLQHFSKHIYNNSIGRLRKSDTHYRIRPVRFIKWLTEVTKKCAATFSVLDQRFFGPSRCTIGGQTIRVVAIHRSIPAVRTVGQNLKKFKILPRLSKIPYYNSISSLFLRISTPLCAGTVIRFNATIGLGPVVKFFLVASAEVRRNNFNAISFLLETFFNPTDLELQKRVQKG